MHVSFYTDEEIKVTLDYVMKELDKYVSSAIYNNRIQNSISNEDIYKCYLKWASTKRQLKDPKYFREYLIGEYEKLINEFGIVVHKSKPFRDKEIEGNEIYGSYAEQIVVNTAINYDALNIFYIESLRGTNNEDIISTQFLFVTADMSLLNWDMSRGKTAVVVSPSSWLTLMDRLVGRNDDDYTCFVNFINLKSTDGEINNKEFFQIVKVLSEMIEDIDTQESILNVMIKENFLFLESDSIRTPEFIEKMTQKKALSIDEGKYKDLEEKNRQSNIEIQSLKRINEQKEREIQSKNEEIQRNKIELENHEELIVENKDFRFKNNAIEKLNRRKIGTLVFIVIITIPLLFELFMIFAYKTEAPLSYRLYNAIVAITIFEQAGMVGYYKVVRSGLYFVVFLVDFKLSKIFWNKETQTQYIAKLKDNTKKSGK